MSAATGPRATGWAMAIVAAAAFGAFWVSTANTYTNHDDDFLIFNNPLIRDFSWAGIGRIFFGFERDVSYLPLTLLSFALEYRFLGLDPVWTHGINVFLHAVNACLVLLLARRYGVRTGGALAAGLLFAVHPLQTEAVAWASQRKELLCALFSLGAILAYSDRAESRRPGRYALTLALYAAAMLAKPMAIGVPLALLAIDLYYGRRIRWRAVFEKIPFLAAWPIGIATLVRRAAVVPALSLDPISLSDRLAGTGHLLLFYANKLVLPVKLSVFYPDLFRSDLEPLAWRLAGWAAVLAAVAAVARLARKSSVAFLGSALFLTLLSPAFPLLDNGNLWHYDHYFYLPSAGLFLAISSIVVGRKRRTRHSIAVALILAILVGGWGILSRRRCEVWSDSQRLWQDALRKNPPDPYIYWKLGLACVEAGQRGRADKYLARARKEWRDPSAAWRITAGVRKAGAEA